MGNNQSDNLSDFDEFDFGPDEEKMLESFSEDAGVGGMDEREFLEVNGSFVYMYVVGEARTSCYKLGHSLCPLLRRVKIQPGNPRRLIYKRVLKLQTKKKRGHFGKLLALVEITEAEIISDLASFLPDNQGAAAGWFEFSSATKPILYDVFQKKVKKAVNLNKDWITVEEVPKKN